jgi:DNA-binding NarL/FixJ family response regulator
VPDPTRILLIDDHSLFREAIARLLAAQPDFEIAGECATVEEGVRIVKHTPVDMVLLDINLGSQQGGAFFKLARAEGFNGKILVVTAGVSKLEATRLLERGCSGIFLKQEGPQLLIESIRGIMNRARDGTPQVAKAAPQQLDTAAPDVPHPLTRRERQVLGGVFSGQSNKEIAFGLGVSEPLVKSIMQQLFTKTGVRTRSQLIRVAIERYWKELEEEEGQTKPR